MQGTHVMSRQTLPTLSPSPKKPSFERELDPALEMLARWMDSVFRIPVLGVRFGLDAIIGLVPGIGDLLTSLASLYILSSANRYGIPRVTLARMAANIAIDYVLGSIPVVGDVFDLYWKSNLKNLALLRRHLESNPTDQRSPSAGDWLF